MKNHLARKLLLITLLILIGIYVLLTSALREIGIDDLKEQLAGRASILAGLSVANTLTWGSSPSICSVILTPPSAVAA